MIYMKSYVFKKIMCLAYHRNNITNKLVPHEHHRFYSIYIFLPALSKGGGQYDELSYLFKELLHALLREKIDHIRNGIHVIRK